LSVIDGAATLISDSSKPLSPRKRMIFAVSRSSAAYRATRSLSAAVNWIGHTALKTATDMGYHELSNLLREHGAEK